MNPGLVIALVGVALLVGTNYASALDRAKAELIVQPAVGKVRMNLSEARVTINLTVKNPTNGSFEVHVPAFNVKYKDTLLASTNPQPSRFPVKAYSTYVVKDIPMTLRYVDLLLAGANLKDDLLSGKPITVQLETLSTIYTPAAAAPFKQIDDLVLQK